MCASFFFFSFLFFHHQLFTMHTLLCLLYLPLAVPQSQSQIKEHRENVVAICTLKYNSTNFAVQHIEL